MRNTRGKRWYSESYSYTTLLEIRVSVGLATARSRSRSDSPPDCHSFRSRRFATLISCGSKSEVLPRAARISEN